MIMWSFISTINVIALLKYVFCFAWGCFIVDCIPQSLHNLEELIEISCLLVFDKLDFLMHKTVDFFFNLLGSTSLLLCLIWNEAKNICWFWYLQSMIFHIWFRLQTNIETGKFVFRLNFLFSFLFLYVSYTLKSLKYFCHLFVDILLILLELLHYFNFELLIILPHLLKQAVPMLLPTGIASLQVVQYIAAFLLYTPRFYNKGQ